MLRKFPIIALLLLLSSPAFSTNEVQSKEAQEPESVDSPAVSMQPIIDPRPQPAVKVKEVPVAPATAGAPATAELAPAFDDENKWNPFPIGKASRPEQSNCENFGNYSESGRHYQIRQPRYLNQKNASKTWFRKNESLAFMEIWDEIPGQTRNKSFEGWMFSSSPAISALEHPIYDVILLECVKPDAKKNSDAKPAEEKPKQ